MNHRQLRAFHAVAGAGGFTRAATALGVTQPTLSGQVAALEEVAQHPLGVAEAHGQADARMAPVEGREQGG